MWIGALEHSIFNDILTGCAFPIIGSAGQCRFYSVKPSSEAGRRILNVLLSVLDSYGDSHAEIMRTLIDEPKPATSPLLACPHWLADWRDRTLIMFDNLLLSVDVKDTTPAAVLTKLARACADAFQPQANILCIGDQASVERVCTVLIFLFEFSPDLAKCVYDSFNSLAQAKAVAILGRGAAFWDTEAGRSLRFGCSFRSIAQTTVAAPDHLFLSFSLLWRQCPEFRFRTLAWHFCDQYGWDTAIVDALRPGSPQELAEVLDWNRLVEFRTADDISRVPELSSLYLPGWEQFGNACVQLSHMYCFARVYGVEAVYFGEAGPFRPNAEQPFRLILGVPVVNPGGACLSGTFFHEMSWYRLSYWPNDQEIREFVYKSIKPELRFDAVPLPLSTLCMHIRAGDNFKEQPNPDYGQPPLSFYKKVVYHDRPAQVILVFQDMKNPVIEPLIQFLDSHQMDYRIQSGSLAEDLSTLYQACNLCLSNSTLGHAVVKTSRHIRRVYSFEWDNPELRYARQLEWLRFNDLDGEYVNTVMSGNFANTLEQRALMLSYSEDAIGPERALAIASGSIIPLTYLRGLASACLSRTRGGRRLRTGPAQWSYAAYVEIDFAERSQESYQISVSLKVEAGEIGAGWLDKRLNRWIARCCAPLGEQVILLTIPAQTVEDGCLMFENRAAGMASTAVVEQIVVRGIDNDAQTDVISSQTSPVI